MEDIEKQKQEAQEKNELSLYEEMFGKDENTLDRLGQGLHNNQFYYAGSTKDTTFIITNKRKCFKKGKKLIDNGKKPLVVEFDEIKENFGLNYLNDFDRNAIDTHWENTDILNYLKNKNEKLEIKQLVEDMIKLNEKHVYHKDKRFHKLISYFILYTYAYSLFEFAPRLNIYAFTSSGKSTQTKLIKYACFNPMWISKATQSSLMRSVEATCCVALVDNLDKVNDELKQTIFHFLEVSFDKEGLFRLSESNGQNWQTKKFASYCAMVVNSTSPLNDDAVANRCILVRMEKTNKKMPKLNTKDKQLRNIRNNSRLYVLENFEKIIKTSEEIIVNENRLKDRTLDIWLGILTFAKINNNEDYEELILFANELQKENQNINDSETLPKIICEVLLEKFEKEKTNIIQIDVSDFADEVYIYQDNLDVENDFDKAKISKWHRKSLKDVEKNLKAMPSIWCEKNIKNYHNKTQLLVEKKDVLAFMEAREYTLEKKENELTLTNNTNKPNNPNKPNTIYVSNVSNVSNVSRKLDSPNFPKNEELVVEREYYD